MERWAEMEDPTARQLKEAEATVQAMEASPPPCLIDFHIHMDLATHSRLIRCFFVSGLADEARG